MLWFPSVGKATDVLSFSREEAFALLSAPEKPLLGYGQPPTLEWLPEPEECRGREEFSGHHPLDAEDVYLALSYALWSFKHAERRIIQVWTTVNLEHAKLLKNRAQSLLNTLKDPRTVHIYGGTSLQSSLANVERDYRRFKWIVDTIERQLVGLWTDSVVVESAPQKPVRRGPPWGSYRLRHRPCESRNLEEFVNGPLANCYKRLFGPPGRSDEPNRPFPNSANAFWASLGILHLAQLSQVPSRRVAAPRRAASRSGRGGLTVTIEPLGHP